MTKLKQIIKNLYSRITDKYIDEKGCNEKYYSGRHCEYKHDCHYKFLFQENSYCLNKELGSKEDEAIQENKIDESNYK